ncbi:hypothetical protein A2210_02565 [Candidatus Woesebacteria bacterium RIFOXYA1_FULL_40_18]|uniref:Uncharacterized protein n=1 Tax=Candidatus Woesebacteria bacterium RIFOXYA1_FULL_40_18 TaxID=1802532 RepID=A0A1F8CLR8_9BACT|nr:MAG: hypothetical protein A2210_02565 [Candidatus Woesebacteria bacterium RIFOXYA1_FULL_40_18]
MKKLIWLTTIIILFLVFVVPGVFALPIDMIPANDQPGYSVNEKLSLYGKRIISQKFISQEDNLSAIGISLGNPNLKNKKQITLSIYDVGDNLMRTSVINGQNLEDGDFVKFVFPQIPDSKNKDYRFTIVTPEAGAEEVIYIYHTQSILSWMEWAKFTDGIEKEVEGGLPFVAFHTPKSKLEVIRTVYSRFLPSYFQKP